MVGEQSVAVLLNANAKRFNRRVVSRIGAVVPNRDIFVSRTREEANAAARQILERGYPTVCTGGGDGTLVQFVTSAHEILGARPGAITNAPDIGVLKLGTGNAIASYVGAGTVEDDLRKMRAGLAPLRAPLPLIEADGTLCHFVGMGVDAAIINDYNETQAKWLSGGLRYFASVLSRSVPRQLTTRRQRPIVRIVNRGRPAFRCGPSGELAGEPIPHGAVLYEGPMTLVGASTTPFYGYGMRIYPFAGQQAGRVQLRVAHSGVFEILSRLPALWNGTHRSATIHDFWIDAVDFEFSRPAPLQVAGDPRGYRERLSIRLSERSVQLVDLRPPQPIAAIAHAHA
jgi:diacylglycerol kinase family enzyme